MKGFYSIWLEEVDSRRYAALRIGFSILLLLHFLWLLPYSDSLLSNEGISSSNMSDIGFHEITGGKSISLFSLIQSPIFVSILLLSAIVLCILSIFGKYSRLAIIFCFLIQLSIIHRAPISTTGWDSIITNLCIILIFSPLGTHWNPVNLLRNQKPKEPDINFPRYGLVLIQIQTCIIYWQSVFQKMGDYYWKNGESITYFLLSHHGRFQGKWPVHFHGLFDKINYLTLLIELTLPLLLWISKTRKIGVIIGIGFHVSIAILGINLTLFSMTMIICYLAFFPVWEKETKQETGLTN